MTHVMNQMTLPDRALTLIYEYDPTYHREQFRKVLLELPWTVSIFRMISEQKDFHRMPTEGVEFKREAE